MRTMLIAVLMMLAMNAYCNDRQFFLSAMHEAIYHEARGEPTKGQIIVGQVILNRVDNWRFPDTIHEVVYQPRQFSYADDVPPVKENIAYRKTFLIALAVLTNIYYNDQYKDSIMYYACSGKHKLKRKPKWDWTKIELDGRVGNHCFYSYKKN